MSITEKIIVRENKILKLNNILIREINNEEDLDLAIHMMESYVKSKGNDKVGPLVIYSGIEIRDDEIKMITKIMFQLKAPIHSLDNSYKFKTQIKISNCLFARYKEKEENLNFAYSKLQLFAFENNRKLKGDSYTVFLDNKEGELIADIFMEEKCESL